MAARLKAGGDIQGLLSAMAMYIQKPATDCRIWPCIFDYQILICYKKHKEIFDIIWLVGPYKFEYIWRAGHVYSNLHGPTSHIYPKIGNIRYYMIFKPCKIGNRPCKFENRHIRYYMAANFEYRPIFEVSCARSNREFRACWMFCMRKSQRNELVVSIGTLASSRSWLCRGEKSSMKILNRKAIEPINSRCYPLLLMLT